MADHIVAEEAERARVKVEMFKIKKLVKFLNEARGNGTSMVSLIIPPKDQLSRVNKMLTDEVGAASNIKSRVNRLSVINAIQSAQSRLKMHTKVPPNGLIIFTGTIVNDEGKEKKVAFDFEPFKAINTSMYMCDTRFHTDSLLSLIEDEARFGFIVMDGNGTLFGAVSGNTREVLHNFTVDLPKKHGRGGQSAVRFSRLRMEARHNYVRKVAEAATQLFINVDRPNVAGLILAGSADFKTELSQSDMFDGRLQPIIIKIVDISYGGHNGFNQAIELSSDALTNVKFVQEKKLLQKFFDQIQLDTGKYCYGVEDTLKCMMDMRACETLIVFENLECERLTVKNPQTEEVSVQHLRGDQLKNIDGNDHLRDTVTGVDLEIIERQSLVEWFTEHYQEFGVKLEFVTDRSQEGSQFVKGFGGIGGLLRYKVDLEHMAMLEDDDMWED